MNKRQRKKAFKKWLDNMANDPMIKQMAEDLAAFENYSMDHSVKLLNDAMIMDNPFRCSRVPFMSGLADSIQNSDHVKTLTVMKPAACGRSEVVLNDNIVLPKPIDGVVTIVVGESYKKKNSEDKLD